MMALVTPADSGGAPSRRARAVSGSNTGSAASLAPGAVAHSPTNASSPSPSTDSDTAGSGRASGLDFSVRMSTPISASTRPPGIGGSASLAGCAAARSDALVTGPWVIASPRARASGGTPGLAGHPNTKESMTCMVGEADGVGITVRENIGCVGRFAVTASCRQLAHPVPPMRLA